MNNSPITKALLAVSFGTSFPETRKKTIEAIELALAEAFPEYALRRSFTSRMVIRIIAREEGVTIDNVNEAVERAARSGMKELVVQPTHLMDGIEYHKVAAALECFRDRFASIRLGKPLLDSDEDFRKVMDAITADTAAFDDGDTAICFMGHGTDVASNAVYAKLQTMLTEAGHKNYYIATVEAKPDLADLLAAVKQSSCKKVLLQPLMIVAGDHATNDMAGDDEDSWKSVFTAAGYEVSCVLKGLGEIPAIRSIFIDHARDAK